MTDVDCLDLLAQGTGICFKIGAEGSFGVAAQGKGCFLCPTNSLIYQGLCLFMQRVQVPCNGRQLLLPRLCKKRGSVDNTRLLPHAKIIVFFVG